MKTLLILAVVGFVFGGCNSFRKQPSEESVRVLLGVEKVLLNSNGLIYDGINKIKGDLQSNLYDPHHGYKVKIYMPKMDSISQISDQAKEYFFNSFTNLVNQGKKDLTSTKDPGYSVVQDFFFSKNNGEHLVSKMRKFREALLNVDSNAKKEFENTLPIDSLIVDSDKSDEMVANSIFKTLSFLEARIMMVKMINEVNECNYLIAKFIVRRAITTYCGYGEYDYFSQSNSKYFKPGQELVIKSGVGSFGRAFELKIMIDGKVIPLNAEAFAEYKSKVEMKPGKYFKTVKIDFIKPDGTPSSVTKKVEYEVGDCGSDNKK